MKDFMSSRYALKPNTMVIPRTKIRRSLWQIPINHTLYSECLSTIASAYCASSPISLVTAQMMTNLWMNAVFLSGRLRCYHQRELRRLLRLKGWNFDSSHVALVGARGWRFALGRSIGDINGIQVLNDDFSVHPNIPSAFS